MRDALTAGAVGEPTAASAAGLVLLVGVGHGLWTGRARGAVAGLGVALAGWCGALAVSGWLTPSGEAYYVMGALLLLLGSDIVSTLSPDFREDTLIWPTLATVLFLIGFAGMQLIDGESIAQASAVLMSALVGLAVAWSIKRSARRQERSRWRVNV